MAAQFEPGSAQFELGTAQIELGTAQIELGTAQIEPGSAQFELPLLCLLAFVVACIFSLDQKVARIGRAVSDRHCIAGERLVVHVETDARSLSGDAAPVGGTSGSTDIRELLLVF